MVAVAGTIPASSSARRRLLRFLQGGRVQAAPWSMARYCRPQPLSQGPRNLSPPRALIYGLETRYDALATSFFSLLASVTFVAELIRSINRMPFK